ncbi:MAG: hypothetical protein EBX40_03075, partial [Gammaproteobacteria bacterium]|nr:hypothetical protein [Gammaproteobacteria bacterium]
LKSKGDNLLRVAQFKKAMSGDTSALIWLGKNRLGQSDKQEIKGDSVVRFTLNLDGDSVQPSENDGLPESDN